MDIENSWFIVTVDPNNKKVITSVGLNVYRDRQLALDGAVRFKSESVLTGIAIGSELIKKGVIYVGGRD